MSKGSGTTRGSSSSSPRGLAVGAVAAPAASDLTDTREDRYDYLSEYFDALDAYNAIDAGGDFNIGDIHVSVERRDEDEIGYAEIDFVLSDRNGNSHRFAGGTYNVYSGISDAVGEVRQIAYQFLYDFPQKKRR